jgi:hypothetical protein
VDILLLVCRKAETLLKVGEVACINYFIVSIFIERNSLRNFMLGLLCLLKRIDLILYLVIQIRISDISVCYWKNMRIETYKTVIFTVVLRGFSVR